MSELGGIENAITADVGPLPAWAWGAILVGAYFLYEHLSGGASSADTSTDSTDDTSSDDGTDSGDDSDDSGLDSGDDVEDGDATGATSTGSPVTTSTTNQQWLINAINALRAEGLPAGPVTTALTRYIRAETLTATEAGYVNDAIAAIGPPPSPRQIFPAPPQANPLPVKKPAPKPVKKPAKPKPKKPVKKPKPKHPTKDVTNDDTAVQVF